MGEMVDFTLMEIMDHEDTYSDYLTGNLSDQEAYESGIVNELGGLIGTEVSITCRCCHETGLHWRKFNGKWRLYKNNKLHCCKVNPLKEH